MNKEQAEIILKQLIESLKLTRKEYEILLQAIEKLKLDN